MDLLSSCRRRGIKPLPFSPERERTLEVSRSPKAAVAGARGRAGEGGVLGEEERARDMMEEDTERIRGEKNHLLEASTHGAPKWKTPDLAEAKNLGEKESIGIGRRTLNPKWQHEES
jgi:hypothetical protein